MIYIKRDNEGGIVAASLTPIGEDWEPAAGDEPGMAVFAQGLLTGDRELAVSDLALARVLEDVIDLLVDHSVIRFTDLPQAAQVKLNARQSARASIRKLNLLDEDDGLL